MGIGDKPVGLYRGESGDPEGGVQSVFEGDDADAEEVASGGVLDPVFDELDGDDCVSGLYWDNDDRWLNRYRQDETSAHQAGRLVPQATSN